MRGGAARGPARERQGAAPAAHECTLRVGLLADQDAHLEADTIRKGKYVAKFDRSLCYRWLSNPAKKLASFDTCFDELQVERKDC